MDALTMTLEESQDPAKLEEAALGLAQRIVAQANEADLRTIQQARDFCVERIISEYRQEQTVRDLAEECGEDNEVQE